MNKIYIFTASGLSLVAGAIHAIVTPEHFNEWWGYGLFFLATAIFQIGYGLVLALKYKKWIADLNPAVTSSSTRFYYLGIAINLGIIVLYLFTRTVGIPLFGPHAGEIEEITGISVISKIIEPLLVINLALLIKTKARYSNFRTKILR